MKQLFKKTSVFHENNKFQGHKKKQKLATELHKQVPVVLNKVIQVVFQNMSYHYKKND